MAFCLLSVGDFETALPVFALEVQQIPLPLSCVLAAALAAFVPSEFWDYGIIGGRKWPRNRARVFSSFKIYINHLFYLNKLVKKAVWQTSARRHVTSVHTASPELGYFLWLSPVVPLRIRKVCKTFEPVSCICSLPCRESTEHPPAMLATVP